MITELDFSRFNNSQKVLNTKDFSVGCDRYVYLFETTEGKYIVKKAKECKEAITNEILVKSIITDITLPFPHILYADETIIVETYIEGHHLNDYEPVIVYKEIGECLRKLHTIKRTGFGFMNELGIGKFSNEKESITELIDVHDPIFKVHSMLKSVDVAYIVQKNIELLDSKESVLIHADLYNQNILANNGRLAGIIDFADSMAGSPERDLGLFYMTYGKKELWDAFLEGYNKEFNHKKFLLYAFIYGTWIISRDEVKEGDLVHKKYLKTIEKLTS